MSDENEVYGVKVSLKTGYIIAKIYLLYT